MRAAFHREFSWAPVLSRRAQFVSPRARIHALRQLLAERQMAPADFVSRPGCWHASDSRMTIGLAPRQTTGRKHNMWVASRPRPLWFFRATATIRESFLKCRHLKK